MSAEANKRLLERVFADLSTGNPQTFLNAVSDDVRWTISGTTAWSGTYQGKETVLNEVFVPVFSQYAEPYRASAKRIIADDEHVVVEARGGARTKSGRGFDNSYCYVFHLANGLVDEVVEYSDTLHSAQTLEPPAGRVRACARSSARKTPPARRYTARRSKRGNMSTSQAWSASTRPPETSPAPRFRNRHGRRSLTPKRS